MNKHLLELFVCPICKGKLHFNKKQKELICPVDRLAFPIEDNIPAMIEADARQLATEEEI